jgi:hypothetical protein
LKDSFPSFRWCFKDLHWTSMGLFHGNIYRYIS